MRPQLNPPFAHNLNLKERSNEDVAVDAPPRWPLPGVEAAAGRRACSVGVGKPMDSGSAVYLGIIGHCLDPAFW